MMARSWEMLICALTAVLDWLEAHEGLLTALATVFIAAFTIALASSTKKLWREAQAASKIAEKSANAALETAKSLTLSERAYVKMSHCPPGLVRDTPPRSGYTVHMRVKNFGRTPATVTDVVITYKIISQNELLPRVPEYQWPGSLGDWIRHPPALNAMAPPAPGSTSMFLVTEDEFFTFQHFAMTTDDIEDGTQALCVYGYVDYIDQFRQRHRAGFARRYDPTSNDPTIYRGDDEAFKKRSNLNFVDQEGYNYDRQRKQGEGNDWGTYLNIQPP